MKQLNKALKKNILTSFLMKGVGIFVNIALIPLGLNFLDKDRFGIWLIINSILLWMTFFDLGLGNGLRNKLTEVVARKRVKEAKNLISTGYISVIVAVALFYILFLLTKSLIEWNVVFNVPNTLNKEISIVVFWSISLILLQVILKNINFILLSLQLSAINSSLVVISNILTLITLLYLDFNQIQGSLLQYALILCGFPVGVYFIATILFFYGPYHFLRPNKFIFNKASFNEIGVQSWKFFIIQLSAMLLFQGNNILITQFFGPGEVTNYNISYRYFNIIIMAFSILLTPFWSAFNKAYHEGNSVWISSTINNLKKLWYLAIIGVVFMILVSEYVYTFWIGNSIKIDLKMDIANGLYTIIYVWNSIYLYFINGIGKIQIQYYSTITVMILYIPLTLFFMSIERDPSTIIFTNCFMQLLFSILCYTQVTKILKGESYGIWSR